MDFSETIAAWDLKLIELMKISGIEGIQGHFLTLAKGHLHMKLELVLSVLSVTTGPFSAQF